LALKNLFCLNFLGRKNLPDKFLSKDRWKNQLDQNTSQNFDSGLLLDNTEFELAQKDLRIENLQKNLIFPKIKRLNKSFNCLPA
jgi:hypothetical protein